MQIKSTPISGLLEIIPKVHSDPRGWFLELFKEESFKQVSPAIKFVQENLSFSQKGVLRGLHLQLPPFQQAKLVTVISGRVLDIVVDLRKGSTTFGESFRLELSGMQHNILLVPEGFAHGFVALEDSYFYYKCSSVYNPGSETGIIWNDAQLKIDWGIDNPILSEKDTVLPTLDELLRKSVISPS
ncbi:MAG: dTDP-4-dehydrorhamnose 3,5-epimerase [Cyclobacteriaceae bacterium]